VKSTAILFGEADRLIIGVLQVMMFIGLWLLGQDLELSILFKWSLAVAAGFAMYQQWLIRHRAPKRCFQAFLNNNWLGAAIFVGLVLEYL
jgi:4-hydroxybenzoate polyprenyltransferase